MLSISTGYIKYDYTNCFDFFNIQFKYKSDSVFNLTPSLLLLRGISPKILALRSTVVPKSEQPAVVTDLSPVFGLGHITQLILVLAGNY